MSAGLKTGTVTVTRTAPWSDSVATSVNELTTIAVAAGPLSQGGSTLSARAGDISSIAFDRANGAPGANVGGTVTFNFTTGAWVHVNGATSASTAKTVASSSMFHVGTDVHGEENAGGPLVSFLFSSIQTIVFSGVS